METKVVKLENTNLHILKNDNFKTTTIEAKFRINTKKEEVPVMELLSNALVYTTKTYSTKKDYINKCKDLYDVITSCYLSEDGRRESITLRLSFLNDKYSEEGLLEEVIKFAHEIIYNPNITDGKYDEETFNAVLVSKKAYLETLKEDKTRYAAKRLFEIMNEDDQEFISVLSKENYEIVANTTRESLASAYNNLLSNSELDILIIGDISIDETEKMFKKYFKEKHGIKYTKDPNKYYEEVKKANTIFESDKSSQAKLNIAYNIPKDLSSDDKLITLQMLNMMLGSSPNSLFFKNIREKHSICYYINTTMLYFDNLIVVTSGISKENYDKMLKLIKKEIKKVIDKDYPDSLLEEVKKNFLSDIKSTKDSEVAMLRDYYNNKIDGFRLFDDRVDLINKVTKDDIKEMASKLKINTIYMFGGDSKND